MRDYFAPFAKGFNFNLKNKILKNYLKRSVLEENGQLKPRWSALEEDLDAIAAEEEANKIVSIFNLNIFLN